MVDIVIGILVFTDIIHVETHSFMAAIICFIIGLIYFMGGITIAVVKMRKKE
jgi:uncharacterized membrane protein YczE